jgi:hypothetical protein
VVVTGHQTVDGGGFQNPTEDIEDAAGLLFDEFTGTGYLLGRDPS